MASMKHFLLPILLILPVMYIHQVTKPPNLPEIDQDQWWGPYPIEQKKDLSIRPFQIEFTDVVINDLRERLLHRRPFVPPLEDAGFTYGFNSNFLTRVLDFWQNKYNFKEREQFLNQYSHFKTNVQGLDIHYIHVKPKSTAGVKVVPLLLLHGWPGSVREFYEIIPKLVTPRPNYKFVFELVIPSLPGYGFSQVKITWVNGVPGCGKSKWIAENYNPGKDLVIATTTESTRDLKEKIAKRIGTKTRAKARTMASVLANGIPATNTYERLMVDETLMNHFGAIVMAVRITGAKKVLLFGDINQLPFIDRSNLFRLKLHRRPFVPPLEDAGFTYGFNSNFLTRVLDFWQNKYNFKEREQFLNQYSHFKTNVQGLDIHYIHVKPKSTAGVKVVPLLLLHGWPGSVREFYEIIPKLVTPRPNYKFVFELVIPSLPGYGFSQAPVRSGCGPLEVGVLLHNLMKRLGHDKYYLQGGDYGHMIGSYMVTVFPNEILGFHTNMPTVNTHKRATIYSLLGSLWPSLLVEPELQDRMYPLTAHYERYMEELGYLHIQATKPDTIGTALTDSPAGLAAYILEKFSTWTNNENRKAADGNLLAKFSLTHLLDNVMIYWTTNSITTSMRLYAETFNKRTMAFKMDEIETTVPTWGLKLKYEQIFCPDALLKLKYVNYLHSTVVEDGGHFAALEMPDLVAEDIYNAVDTFRDFHNSRKGDKKEKEISPQTEPEKPETIYDFTVRDIHGSETRLDKYRGYVLLIVNVASQCGLTDTNYKQLNELYDKYAEKGLRILAFPCNQFGSQEPGSHKQIFNFAKERGAKYDIFEKVDVNGDNAHPMWKFLKRTQSGTLGDYIKWNFSKFIVDKRGVPVERFGPNVDPLDLEPQLEKYL